MDDVQCIKCGQLKPPIAVPVYGKSAAEIKRKICMDCWNEWLGVSVKIINEYRLNMADPYSREMVAKQMRAFLNLPESAPA